jgi:putative acetyltransferase
MDEIFRVPASRFHELQDVWEQAVSHSNSFYNRKEVNKMKSMLFDIMKKTHFLAIGDPEIDAFIGIQKDKIAMLYVRPEKMKSGLGSKLLNHVLNTYAVSRIDVHSKNDRAIKLYRQVGFKPVAFFAVNVCGNTHQILQMKL